MFYYINNPYANFREENRVMRYAVTEAFYEISDRTIIESSRGESDGNII